MKIIVAHNKKFETHNIITKFIRVFTVPLLNSLPSLILKKVMVFSSRDAATTIKHGGSTRALEAMYTRSYRTLFSRGILQGFADLFWHHCVSQPKAVRNRLKIVEDNLETEILRLVNSSKNIKVLSVGGGSTRGIVYSLNRIFKKNFNCKIGIINIDKSSKALKLGKEIARRFSLQKNFKWIKDDARNIKFLIPNNSIDIVEMVGLLDYFSDEKGIEVISQIYNVLRREGLFIVANIYPNVEMPFIRKTGWPEMYYRMPEDLSKILKKAGFSLHKGKIIFEPLKSHIIVIIRK